MRVPFLDLRQSYISDKFELDRAVARVLDSGYYIGGPEVEFFERSFAKVCHADHCIAVSNGLDALRLGLEVLGVGPGDEVIVPSNTYIATWLAALHLGAVVVPVEPDPATHNLDPALIEAAITKRTKVLLPVHLYGHPADMGPIMELAARFGLKVLEDAAQAHGAVYDGKPIGAHGDVIAWSFYPTKNLGAFGDAGAITTDDAELAHKLKMLRNYGSSRKYVNEYTGYNNRIDPLQAAMLAVKLDGLAQAQDRRRALADRYLRGLSDANIILPGEVGNVRHAWHLFVIRSRHRDILAKRLEEHGVGTLIHYPIAPHKQQAFAGHPLSESEFPIAERLASELLSLPLHPHLTDDDADYVITTLNAVSTDIEASA